MVTRVTYECNEYGFEETYECNEYGFEETSNHIYILKIYSKDNGNQKHRV